MRNQWQQLSCRMVLKTCWLVLAIVGSLVHVAADDDFGPRHGDLGNTTTAAGHSTKKNKTVCTVTSSKDGSPVNGSTLPLWGTLRRCIHDLNIRKLNTPQKKREILF